MGATKHGCSIAILEASLFKPEPNVSYGLWLCLCRIGVLYSDQGAEEGNIFYITRARNAKTLQNEGNSSGFNRSSNRVVLREASNVRAKFRRETPNLEPQSHNLFAALKPKP